MKPHGYWQLPLLVRAAGLIASLVIMVPAHAVSPDAAKGKGLHDRQCVACHAERFGGDGSVIYTRPNRLIRDRAGLAKRVAMCAGQTDAGWFPEDEADVTAYLAQRFYKFP